MHQLQGNARLAGYVQFNVFLLPGSVWYILFTYLSLSKQAVTSEIKYSTFPDVCITQSDKRIR